MSAGIQAWSGSGWPHRQRVSRKGELFNDPSMNQMILNDSLKNLGTAGVIPGALGVHHSNRSVQADTEAIGFGAKNRSSCACQPKLFQPALQEFPGFHSGSLVTTLGLRLIRTKEDVPLEFSNTNCAACGHHGLLAHHGFTTFFGVPFRKARTFSTATDNNLLRAA